MEKQIICAASFYERKYFFDPQFENFPEQAKIELRALCGSAAETIRGIFCVGYYDGGSVFFEARGHENDGMFDEIGAKITTEALTKQKAELIGSLRMYYKLYKTADGEKIRGMLK